jgi:hypothetical protein
MVMMQHFPKLTHHSKKAKLQVMQNEPNKWSMNKWNDWNTITYMYWQAGRWFKYTLKHVAHTNKNTIWIQINLCCVQMNKCSLFLKKYTQQIK